MPFDAASEKCSVVAVSGIFHPRIHHPHTYPVVRLRESALRSSKTLELHNKSHLQCSYGLHISCIIILPLLPS